MTQLWSPRYKITPVVVSLSGYSIRQSAGPALKAALVHTWTRDTLDDHIMASKGALLRLTNELAVTKRVTRSLLPSPYTTNAGAFGGSGTSGNPPFANVGEGTTAFWKLEGEAKRGWVLTKGLVSSLVADLRFRRYLRANSPVMSPPSYFCFIFHRLLGFMLRSL